MSDKEDSRDVESKIGYPNGRLVGTVVKVQTNKGLVPFSIKRMGTGAMVRIMSQDKPPEWATREKYGNGYGYGKDSNPADFAALVRNTRKLGTKPLLPLGRPQIRL